MSEITNAIAETKRLRNENAKLVRERTAINATAIKLRADVRRLKRLLDAALKHIPTTVRDDKFFEEVDEVLHKVEI